MCAICYFYPATCRDPMDHSSGSYFLHDFHKVPSLTGNPPPATQGSLRQFEFPSHLLPSPAHTKKGQKERTKDKKPFCPPRVRDPYILPPTQTRTSLPPPFRPSSRRGLRRHVIQCRGAAPPYTLLGEGDLHSLVLPTVWCGWGVLCDWLDDDQKFSSALSVAELLF